MIDIRQLRYFVTLAETLHFGRAAERLHLSQPPLSRQIAALEKDLGVRLLERHSRKVSLTFAGRQFAEDARGVIAGFDQACRNAQLAERGELGELSIGFMMHAAYSVLPKLTRAFTTAYRIRLQLREAIPSTIPDAVLAGRFDVGLTLKPGVLHGLESKPVHRERLCLAIQNGHPLAARSKVTAAHLADEALIAAPGDVAPTLREAIVNYCRGDGFEPSFKLETQLQHTIISLVSEGLGIALVPESLRRLGMSNVVFRDLKDAPAVEHVLLWRPGNTNPALGLFLDMHESADQMSSAV